MSSISAQNETMVNSLRSYLRTLAKRRASATVTADDAQNYMTKQGIPSQRIRTRLALINAALQGGEFYQVGKVASTRPAARGRQITEWSL